MSNFFQNLFDGGDKKKKTGGGQSLGGGGGGPKNPFANMKLNLPGQKFNGAGKSLGGQLPGKIIPVRLEQEGPLGLKVERRPNGKGTAIVSLVVEGSQAEEAGLQRGDILCFPGSEGTSEILFDDFLQMAKSSERPIVFDVRRIASNTKSDGIASGSNTKSSSADAYARKQAVIAAAEARDKANKKWSKPVGKKGDKKLTEEEKRRKGLEMERDAQLKQQEAPRSEEARKAMEAAKQSEQQWASQLGYNPYETNKVSSGQARNATVTSQHGTVGSGGYGSDTNNNLSQHSSQQIPEVRPPSDPANAATDGDGSGNDDAMLLSQAPEFDEAYTTMVTTNSHDDIVQSFGIIRKLVGNATTKGQDISAGEEAAAKFRRVRLANPKIKAAIVDVNGGLDLMMAFGFQFMEEDGENFLAYPLLEDGSSAVPNFLDAGLRQMERYEKS